MIDKILEYISDSKLGKAAWIISVVLMLIAAGYLMWRQIEMYVQHKLYRLM